MGAVPVPKDGALAKAFGVQGKRDCSHVAVAIASALLRVALPYARLAADQPPHRTKNTALATVLNSKAAALLLSASPVDVGNVKGGPEYALLAGMPAGVFIAVATISGRSTEEHAFVYQSFGEGCGGVLYDGRKGQSGLQLDVQDVVRPKPARAAVSSWYGGATVRVHTVVSLSASAAVDTSR